MPQPFPDLNRDVTEKALRKAGEQLRDGKITAARFEKVAAEEIRSGVVAGFRFAAGGRLSDRQTKLLNNLLSEQKTYFDRFTAGIKDGSVSLDAVPNRATLYTSGLTQAEAYGTLTRDDAGRIYWEASDDAGTCDDCGEMSGEHDAADLLSGGVLPAMGVSCGPSCRCTLIPVEKAA